MGIGFGLVIVIAMVLGGEAVWQMTKVKGNSTILSKEFVPEVQMVSGVERNALETMFQIRGYAFTENKDFLEKGKKSLDEVKKLLEKTNTLITNSTNLKNVKETVDNTVSHINQYEKLLNDSIVKIDAMSKTD